MSSINPNNINGQYPVAGQDNDSQGFRDNFTNIKNNFTFAKTEIEDLQGKVLVTAALAGQTLDNDLNNTLLKGAQLLRTTETVKDLGPSGTDVTVNWDDGHFQYFELTGNADVTFANFPDSGFYTKLRLMVNVTNVASFDEISFTNILNWVGIDNVLGGDSSDNSITFTQDGRYVYEFTWYNNADIFVEQVAMEVVKPQADPYQYSNVSGNVVTVNNSVSTVIVDPPSIFSAANIRMPEATTLLDGQVIRFAFGNTITAVTHWGNGATILGGITTANVDVGASFVFRSSNLTWYRLS